MKDERVHVLKDFSLEVEDLLNREFKDVSISEQVALGYLARGLALARGVILLIGEGLPEDSEILARSLYEARIRASWLLLDGRKRDYRLHLLAFQELVEKERQLARIVDHKTADPEKASRLRTEAKARRDDAKSAFCERFGIASAQIDRDLRTLSALRSMVEQLAAWMEGQVGGKQVADSIRAYYEIIFRITSSAVHSAPITLSRFVYKLGDRSMRFSPLSSRETPEVYEMAFNDLLELFKVAAATAEGRLPNAEEVVARYEAMRDFEPLDETSVDPN